MLYHRRKILELLGYGSAASLFYTSPFTLQQAARGSASGRRPFLLYIHMQSMDGWSAGLVQPHEVGRYPRSVFIPNETVLSPNPNINMHTQDGALILNNYTAMLSEISNHLTSAVGTSRSASHAEARLFQSSGLNKRGAGGAPNWAAGLAQLTGGSSQASYVVRSVTDENLGGAGSTTPNISQINAANFATLVSRFSDTDLLRTADLSAQYADVGKNLYGQPFNSTSLSSDQVRSAHSSIDGLLRGIPGYEQAKIEIDKALTKENAAKRVKDSGVFDHVAVVASLNSQGTTQGAALNEQLRMAALLIETQAANGMTISAPNGSNDLHSGGSAITTARQASFIYAHVVEFWNWIKSKGYENDVLIVMANEFNRTAANNTSITANVITQNNETVSVRAPGTDHHLSMGMYLINGRMPPKSRLGGIADSYVPQGTKNLSGELDASIPAYTSSQIVASAIQRAFPGRFEFRDLRSIWRTLSEDDLISYFIAG